MKTLLLLLPVAFAGLPPHHQKLVDRFGAENVNFDKNVRTAFCDSCMEISVESNGGAQEHQPNRLGRFTRDGSLWENMVPFWTADNAQHITPDPMSNPVIYYLKWVVSETVGGFNAGEIYSQTWISNFLAFSLQVSCSMTIIRSDERRVH